jgi:hypothetical protein
MKNAIGGYFELELRQGEHYHKDAIKLNTARNCLEYILKARAYKKIYIPYYTCEVILEPIRKCNIDYEFYHIDINLEPVQEYELKKEEAFLYTNYFGLKQNKVVQLATTYGAQLIVDNSQAFYAEPVTGIDTFYSARKFFGVPDGAYLYTDRHLNEHLEQDISFERASHLLKRIDLGAESGYIDFQNNDKSLENQSIRRMSKLTERILKATDYESVKEQRIKNHQFMDEELRESNLMKLHLDKNAVPMVYPYFASDKNLKNRLIQNKIFVATYWNNVLEWCDLDALECALVEKLLPLPIDHRYDIENINIILKFL